MLHQRIEPISKKDIDPRLAFYTYAKSLWLKEKMRWVNLYCINPPPCARILPSDEAILTLVSSIPQMRLFKHEVVREWDHDFLLIYGYDKNIFTWRASPEMVRIRESFLLDIERMATSEREVPEAARVAAQVLFESAGFVNVLWRAGKKTTVAYDNHGYRWKSWDTATNSPEGRAFRRFERACAGILPFYLEAAPS